MEGGRAIWGVIIIPFSLWANPKGNVVLRTNQIPIPGADDAAADRQVEPQGDGRGARKPAGAAERDGERTCVFVTFV